MNASARSLVNQKRLRAHGRAQPQKSLTEFGEIVHASRIDQNLSMRECAKELGVSIVYWSDIEKGRRNPFDDKERISRISKLLGISAIELELASSRDRKCLNLDHCDKKSVDLIVRFAQQVSDLDDDELEEINQVLKRHYNE